MKKVHNIKDVAIYLRKSRDESNGTEDVLIKHAQELIDFAKANKWKYVVYKEIGSADNIEYRPQMIQLLNDVQRGLYDGVLVVDLDRLGRGDYADQARIRKVFSDSQTLIVTPNRIYDATNDEEELIWDIEAIFARQEYKMIKKRLARGKKRGAKNGHWTNGKPPFPYKYNPDDKRLEIDEKKIGIYNLIKERFLNGMTSADISYELNKLGVPSPAGKLWSVNAVYRIITSEVHLGKVIYGKTSGSGHKNRKTSKLTNLPRESWIIADGAHPAIKTIEEHKQIISMFQRRKIVPVKSRKGLYPLSGLVYCGKCGYSMQFLTKANGKVFVKNCQHTDPYGNRCTNRGLDSEVLFDTLYYELRNKEKELLQITPNNSSANENLEQLLKDKESELSRLKETFERLLDMYEIGDITREEYIKRRDKRQAEIIKNEKEIENIISTIDHLKNKTDKERLDRIQSLNNNWEQLKDPKEKNRLLKQVLERVCYIRTKNEVNIEVYFL